MGDLNKKGAANEAKGAVKEAAGRVKGDVGDAPMAQFHRRLDPAGEVDEGAEHAHPDLSERADAALVLCLWLAHRRVV